MGEVESLSMAKDEELELSVEELLEVSVTIYQGLCQKHFSASCFHTNEFDDDALQVRRAPQRRGTPRPNRSKPHVIRPVEDITEEEIGLVADNMTDKVYNSITVSQKPQYFFNLELPTDAFPLPPGFNLPPVPSEDC